MNWDNTSGGVTTAATTKAPTITYGRASFSCWMVTTPMRTSTITTIGISNVTPKARIMVITKLKYASMSGACVIDFAANPWMKPNPFWNKNKHTNQTPDMNSPLLAT